MNICETSAGEEAAASSQGDDTENWDEIGLSEKVEPDSDKVKESVSTSRPEETCGNAAAGATSSKGGHGQPASHQESVVFDLDVDDHQEGTSGLNLEIPERGEDEVKQTATPADHGGYEENLRLHQELNEERDEAVAHGARLQARVAEHLRRNAPDEGRLATPEAYESHLRLLSEMRRELSEASESAQQQAERLRLRCQEKQEKVF